MTTSRDAVICEPLRTPVGGYGGVLRDVPVVELAAEVIRAVIARTGIEPASVDDVILGQCYPGSLRTGDHLHRRRPGPFRHLRNASPNTGGQRT